MTFTDPIDFTDALDKLKSKKLVPTFLTSDEIAKIPAELRDKGFFSARQMDVTLLQAFKDSTNDILAGKSNVAKQARDLHDLMDKLGYVQGSSAIDDIYSRARINLILLTNTQMAQGFGQWKQGNEEGALDAFPAQELIRFENRQVPREWFDIWDDAADDLGDETSATDADETGRMVALKNDPIWLAISDFGLPWPPFKFNSGMGVLDVSYEDAVDLGVMDADDEPLDPDEQSLNSGLSASIANLDPDLAQAFGNLLGDAYEKVKDAFVKKPLTNRFTEAIDACIANSNAQEFYDLLNSFEADPNYDASADEWSDAVIKENAAFILKP
jgi:hypothetical protein